MITFLLAIIIFIGYNAWSIVRYGLPPSLSSTYYTPLGRRLLVPVMTASGVLLAYAFRSPHWMDIISAVLGIGGYILVACSPQSRDKKEGRTHLVCAIISAIGTQLLVITNSPYLLISWLAILPLWRWKKHALALWAEYICFITASIIVLMHL